MPESFTQVHLFREQERSGSVPIDTEFDVEFADSIAQLESFNKHLYRPNTYLHKWWARRCGSTFRTILKHLVRDSKQRDYYSPGGLEGLIILDPMMGGGTTLHEAIRLGANVIGADIDPIPVLQARATLSDASIAALQDAFDQLMKRLRRELLSQYITSCPVCAEDVELRYVLYGVRRKCDCGESVVVDSFVLRHNSDDSEIRLSPETGDIYHDDRVVSRATAESAQVTLVEKSERVCITCGKNYSELVRLPYYRRYRPVAVVGECRAHGLFFRAPTKRDVEIIAVADERRAALSLDSDHFVIQPGPKSNDLLNRGVANYLDLFSSRQLLFLDRTIKELDSLERIVRLNLALLISTSLEFNSMLCGYKGAGKRRPGAIRHTFAHHAYSIPYTSLENNPLYPSKSSGTLLSLFHNRIVKGRKWAREPIERVVTGGKARKVAIHGEVDTGCEVLAFEELTEGTRRFLLFEGSSSKLDLPSDSVDFIVTDPPYFDSVQYGDLAAFFRVWLSKLLVRDAHWDYSLEDAAVDQKEGNGQYTEVLSAIFAECRRVLRPHTGRLIFTFHHWNPSGWAALTLALKRSGFQLVNRYVVHAENQASVHIANQNAIVHDVILVLSPSEEARQFNWEFPERVSLSDSMQFCADCGSILGWLLTRDLDDTAIKARWERALST